jgi:hypothetical protein
MPIDYRDIAKAVALRARQFADGSSSTRETSYSSSTISTGIDGVEVPLTALKQDILAVESELAALIASSSNPIFRRSLMALSDPLANQANIPAVDNAGLRFIGSFDAVIDGSDLITCTEQPQVPGSSTPGPRFFFADAPGITTSSPLCTMA